MKKVLQNVLRRTFGMRRLRPGQREVIESVLARRDTLAIMPTGAGKSICYQLPALEMKGSTVVVSPLIALMKDQADGLREHGFNVAEMNSAVPLARRRASEADIVAGRADFVFSTPERLADPAFR